jgi:RNA polymerase sigma-70 factor (ECF subfamily)
MGANLYCGVPDRSPLLRHCYRMLGSFAEADDLVRHLPARVELGPATRVCLARLRKHHHRHLPQNEGPPARAAARLETRGESHWVTPAPDAKLFKSQGEALEKRESVALPFIALLQHLPPRQRAVVLLRDITGLSGMVTAAALKITPQAMEGVLHRARRSLRSADDVPASDEPPEEILRNYARAWERRDARRLSSLLRKDAVLALPPHATWFRGAAHFARFVEECPGAYVGLTRANGCPALSFHEANGKLHAVQVLRFSRGKIAEAAHFTGPRALRGF